MDPKQFLKNAEDSIKHALAHLFEDEELKNFHHRKWFLFSTYHAAQMISLYLLESKQVGFCKTNRYPTLNAELLRKLKEQFPHESYLDELFQLLSENLKKDRDQLWHREYVEELQSIHHEVFALAGILQYCAFQEKKSVSELFDLETEELSFLTDCLSNQEAKLCSSYRKGGKNADKAFRYDNFMTALMAAKHPDSYIYECDYCGSTAILENDANCNACFQEITWRTCDECGSSDPIWAESRNTVFHQCCEKSKTSI